MSGADLGAEIGNVAKALKGDPNKSLSSKSELRFGTNGSLAIDLTKGRWFDHETQVGGNVIELVKHELGTDRAGAVAWLVEHSFLEPLEGRPNDSAHSRHRSRPNGANGSAPATDVGWYVYRDQEGCPVYRVVREEPKRFRQEAFAPESDSFVRHKGCMSGVELLPYRLDELLAETSAPVLVVEGEKDADRLWDLGQVATCNPGGTGKWRDSLSEWLRARDVVVLPDNDPLCESPTTPEERKHKGQGRKHAAQVIRSLLAVGAARVRLLELPDLPLKGDVSDWLDAGHTAEDLQREIAEHAIEPDEAVIARLEAGRDRDLVPLRYMDVMAILGPIPEERFIIERWIPRGYLSSLYGAGGVGKSFLAMMAAVGIVSGTSWLGYDCEPGNVLAVMCEDDERELVRRLYKIAAGLGVDAGALASRLFITPRLGLMNQMMQFHGGGVPTTTELYRNIRAEAKRTAAKLVIIDNAAQTFPGNENDRGQTTAFLNSLVGIAQDIDGAVLLLGHPPKTGSHQFSGSTAWENVPRSRMWFEAKPDTADEYVLHLSKTNRGKPFAINLKIKNDGWGLVENVGEAEVVKPARARGRPSKADQTIRLTEDLYHAEQQPISIRELTREAVKLGIVDHALETEKAWYNREATVRQHLARHPERVEFRSEDTVAMKP